MMRILKIFKFYDLNLVEKKTLNPIDGKFIKIKVL